jgi:hypothetical protein
MFHMTRGRLFSDVLSRVTERRLARTELAPQDPSEFFAFHFDAIAEDSARLNHLEREALTYGTGPIPHEHERQPVIDAHVDEIRRRQQACLIDPNPAGCARSPSASRPGAQHIEMTTRLRSSRVRSLNRSRHHWSRSRAGVEGSTRADRSSDQVDARLSVRHLAATEPR